MSFPWVCPRCDQSNGPGAMVCQNPNCVPNPVTIATGTTTLPRCPSCWRAAGHTSASDCIGNAPR